MSDHFITEFGLRDIHYTHKKVSLDDLFTQALRVALVAV